MVTIRGKYDWSSIEYCHDWWWLSIAMVPRSQVPSIGLPRSQVPSIGYNETTTVSLAVHGGSWWFVMVHDDCILVNDGIILSRIWKLVYPPPTSGNRSIQKVCCNNFKECQQPIPMYQWTMVFSAITVPESWGKTLHLVGNWSCAITCDWSLPGQLRNCQNLGSSPQKGRWWSTLSGLSTSKKRSLLIFHHNIYQYHLLLADDSYRYASNGSRNGSSSMDICKAWGGYIQIQPWPMLGRGTFATPRWCVWPSQSWAPGAVVPWHGINALSQQISHLPALVKGFWHRSMVLASCLLSSAMQAWALQNRELWGPYVHMARWDVTSPSTGCLKRCIFLDLLRPAYG